MLFKKIKIRDDMHIGRIVSKVRNGHVYVRYLSTKNVEPFQSTTRCVVEDYLLRYRKNKPERGNIALFVKSGVENTPDFTLIDYVSDNIITRFFLYIYKIKLMIGKDKMNE